MAHEYNIAIHKSIIGLRMITNRNSNDIHPASPGCRPGTKVAEQGDREAFNAHDPFRIEQRREEEARPRSCSSRRAVTRQGSGGWALKTKRVAAGMDWIDGRMGQDP